MKEYRRRPELPPGLRRRLAMRSRGRSRLLLWAGWLAFVSSLFCPAVIVALEHGSGTEYAVGAFCAAIFYPYYVSNLALVLAPLVLWLLGRARTRSWPRPAFSALYLASGLGALCLLPLFEAVHVGYLLWVTAYFLVGGAAWMARPVPAEGDAGIAP